MAVFWWAHPDHRADIAVEVDQVETDRLHEPAAPRNSTLDAPANISRATLSAVRNSMDIYGYADGNRWGVELGVA